MGISEIVPNNSIEGNPFIIRFKTLKRTLHSYYHMSIEGNPFIIRFKTSSILFSPSILFKVLKVIHL